MYDRWGFFPSYFSCILLAHVGATADLGSLCRAAVFDLWFCSGEQVSVAGDILDEVHEGRAGVRTRPDVNSVAGTAELKSGLRLSPPPRETVRHDARILKLIFERKHFKECQLEAGTVLPTFHPLPV